MFFAPWPREGPEFFSRNRTLQTGRTLPFFSPFLPTPPRLIAKPVPLNAQRKSSGRPLENRYTSLQVYFFAVWKRRVASPQFSMHQIQIGKQQCSVMSSLCKKMQLKLFKNTFFTIFENSSGKNGKFLKMLKKCKRRD